MKRNIGFDVARSTAMIYIVGILHLSGYTELAVERNDAFVSLIWSTLGVFTFLSSFLLASKYTFSNKGDVRIFIKKRVLRFYPLFLLSSLLLLAIHFNTWSETWKGLIGISPVWKPQQHTLWYISMLIGLYALTPLLCKKRRLVFQILLFIGCLMVPVVIDLCFHSVDPRLYYYYIVYFTGILTAQHYKDRFLLVVDSKLTLLLLLAYVPIFLYLLTGGHRLVMMFEGYLGIVVILNLCALVGRAFQDRKAFRSVVSFLSYASMCAYLFHREVYWLLLEIWTPSTDWDTIYYLFFVGLPIVFILSYYIQKGYDRGVNKLQS